MPFQIEGHFRLRQTINPKGIRNETLYTFVCINVRGYSHRSMHTRANTNACTTNGNTCATNGDTCATDGNTCAANSNTHKDLDTYINAKRDSNCDTRTICHQR
jgi:hypothetical protein